MSKKSKKFSFIQWLSIDVKVLARLILLPFFLLLFALIGMYTYALVAAISIR